MTDNATIPPAQRHRGQKSAVFAQLWMPSFEIIMIGPIMMLFANDVLGFNAQTIASIVGLAPLLIVLRFPLLKHIKRLGLKRTVFFTNCAYLLSSLFLMLLPVDWLSLSTFLAIILFYRLAQVVGPSTIWQPLLRGITTNADRGQFFSRMRFSFSIVSLAISAALAFLIGEEISRSEFNILLLLSLLGIVNNMYWIKKIPEVQHHEHALKESRSLLRIVKESTLLKRPLAIVLCTTLATMPMFIVYLRQCLEVPSNMVSAFIFMGTLGSVASMILWGRIADTIGFKPMLIGLILLGLALTPALLLLSPIQATNVTWSTLAGTDVTTISILMFYGLLTGAMAAGSGIASISIQHAHTHSFYALEEMAVFSVIVISAQSVFTLLAGWVIQSLTLGDGSHALFNSHLQWDWTKIYILVILNGFGLCALLLLRKLPNIRAHFDVSDFFQSVFSQPLRTLYRSRFRFDENERTRIQAARLLAHNHNPLAIDPLLALLDDPSYDVRCEAIIALARSQSSVAAEQFMRLLADPERRQLWDRFAWALGELEHRAAGPLLQQHLQDPELAYRTRAMCARALGKIRDYSAAPILAQQLTDNHDSVHFCSSCCCALLHLKSVECIDLVFKEITNQRDRYDRYEIIALCCECLNIDSKWIISAKSAIKTYEMLDNNIQFRSHAWQTQHHDIITLFRSRDHAAIADALHTRIQQNTIETDEKSMLLVLHQAIANSDRWGPNVTLASAWLMHHWAE